MERAAEQLTFKYEMLSENDQLAACHLPMFCTLLMHCMQTRLVDIANIFGELEVSLETMTQLALTDPGVMELSE